ncbi:MAG TPA: hypothetical protein VKM55_09500 [Candidatus Lokiarchaeia archaeon]|nr:hypothetical protein [Candidatus Lokiarchaeia archaeon]
MEKDNRPLPAFFIMITVFSAVMMTVQPVTFKSASANTFTPTFQRGMSYVSWPPNFDSNNSNASLSSLKATGTEWVAINVFWNQDNRTSTRIYPIPDSPSNESVIKAIHKCHELGMKVLLKPVVDPLDGHWRGEIPPSDAWFASYGSFINGWAEFAQANAVEILCIGCEFNGNDGQAASWSTIVTGVRQRFSGIITYAANWNEYRSVSWWGLLDYVGIDAYFPLTQVNDPTIEELKAAWSPWVSEMQSWQLGIGKPIIFTEIGYRSAQGANKAPWDFSAVAPVDLQEQVNCYNATFQVFHDKGWFFGFYWWNWETTPTAGGNSSTDYTPQNKPVQSLVSSWYSEPWERNYTPPALLIPWLWLSAGAILALMILAAFLIFRKRPVNKK